MARTPTRPGTAPPSPHRGTPRRPRPSWLARNGWWLAVCAVVLLGAGVLIGRDDSQPTSPPRAAVVGGDLHSLVVDPANPERLFVGGHQAVATSPDGGRSWQAVSSLESADAMGWAFTADAVYVSGHPGLSRSSDGGQSFQRHNQGLPDTDVHAFGAGGGVLYGASPSAGVFASTDGGRSWQVRSEEAGPGFFGRILVDPDDPGQLTAADARSGPVQSSDGGRSWRKLGGLRAATWVSQAGPDTRALVASGPTGASRSADGGRSWSPVNLPEGALLVEGSATNPELLYAAAHQGSTARVWVSRDGGRTWARP